MEKIVCYGARDQCRVMRPIIQNLGLDYGLLIDDTVGMDSPFEDLRLIRGISALKKEIEKNNFNYRRFIIAIANPYGFIRIRIQKQLQALGLIPVSVCAKSADVNNKTVLLGRGVQVMQHATICANAKIGDQVIINTKASVDHDCILEDGVEVAPGATLCGRVTIKKFSWVCAGATIGPRVTIGENSIIGAGATVLSNVPPNSVYVGTPARFLKENNLTPQNIKDRKSVV